MRKSLAVICVLSFSMVMAGAAMAGDFKGAYIGVNAGGASVNNAAQTTTIFSPTGYFAMSSVPAIATVGNQTMSASGFTGGGLVGYDFQISHVVMGAEADYGAMKLSDSATTTGTYPCCAPTGFTVTQQIRAAWLFSARPRLGFAYHRLLIYATGGVARTHVNEFAHFTDNFATANESASTRENISGPIYGGGLEVRLLKHLSVKGEYLHMDFGNYVNQSTNLTAFSGIAYPSNTFTHTFDFHPNVTRVGFNYRF